MSETPRILCHLYDMKNHHGHAYRRGDQLVHCPGRHAPGEEYVSTRRGKQSRRSAKGTEDR